MKQIFQIIALNLFGFSALQIIAAVGIAVVLLQTALNKSVVTRWWKARKENRDLEDDMWAIE